jgi:diaminopimelate decarboxylase
VQEEVVQQPFTEVVEETVEALNHTGGSHVSYVTTESQSPQNTVIQAAKDEVQEEDSDSDWDSDVNIYKLIFYSSIKKHVNHEKNI